MSKSNADTEADFDVGYGKPPQATQFKKGKSGNPKGRPRGAKGFTASIKRELETRITVREGDRTVKMSKAEAAAKRLVASALSGDMKALTMLGKINPELFGHAGAETDTSPEGKEPRADDLDLLSHFAERARSGDWSPDGEGSES